MRISDWSSDVCSSALTSAPDLIVTGAIGAKGGSGEGHAARAIDIAAGATVTHLTNSGAITASTSGKGVATAIHDGAGGLSLIENSGAIGASASDTTDRKSVVSGKRVSVRVGPGGRRCTKKKTTQ